MGAPERPLAKVSEAKKWRGKGPRPLSGVYVHTAMRFPQGCPMPMTPCASRPRCEVSPIVLEALSHALINMVGSVSTFAFFYSADYCWSASLESSSRSPLNPKLALGMPFGSTFYQ